MRQFHHIGLPTDQSQPGEFFVEDTRVWVTDHANTPTRSNTSVSSLTAR